jgi:hypothetical protein
MIRARLLVAATFVATVSGAGLLAQQAPAGQPAPPEMKSILAGKKFTPPIRGEATIDIVKSPTRREGTTLVTKIQVKNTSNAPIPRLKVAETWFDKDGNMIPGGEAVVNGLLQPGEMSNLEVRTPVNTKMLQSRLQFSHANGTVNAKSVKSLDGGAAAKEPAAKQAAAKPAAKSAKKK